ncbi:hypothetical protein [Roseibium aggregatum]|jgi:hypothetical protein|uniref:Uncharacterized protein n=1 Tax=Roseibium aggregatum TaxID=187304 RepID=A0A0M6YAZ3_9HYPH|nr:hypothetical protein [Roseibium aggregatum]CTQ47266.1 hypothetical protein LAL4801_05728 [Roseibium aggregatum]
MNSPDLMLYKMDAGFAEGIFCVDLEVSMEMQDEYEQDFIDRDMDPGSLHTITVNIEENGSVSVNHWSDSDRIRKFEEDLFAGYAHFIHEEAARMIETGEIDFNREIPAFEVCRVDNVMLGNVYEIKLPVPEHIAHEFQRNQGVPATATYALQVEIDNTGEVGLTDCEIGELERHLFLYHEDKIKDAFRGVPELSASPKRADGPRFSRTSPAAEPEAPSFGI